MKAYALSGYSCQLLAVRHPNAADAAGDVRSR